MILHMPTLVSGSLSPPPKYEKGYSSRKTKMTALLEYLNLEYVICRLRGVVAMFQPSAAGINTAM